MKKILTLISAILFTSLAFAQIPNNSFEQWDTFATYVSPKYWDTPDSITDALSSHGIHTCTVDSPGAPGKYFLNLTSRSLPAPLSTVIPGIAVSGKINYTTMAPEYGFAYTGRPRSLDGKWQYMASGAADHPQIVIFLSKWNTTKSSRDTVAFTDTVITGMAMAWATFAINIKYYTSAVPDSAIIVLSSSASSTTATAGSYLYIDSLLFGGSVLGTSTINEHTATINIFPNPANGYTNLSYNGYTTEKINISISDLNGKPVKEMSAGTSPGENNIPINTSGFAPGIYFIKVIDEQGTEERKLIIQ